MNSERIIHKLLIVYLKYIVKEYSYFKLMLGCWGNSSNEETAKPKIKQVLTVTTQLEARTTKAQSGILGDIPLQHFITAPGE